MDKNTMLKDIAWGEIPRKKLPCWGYKQHGNTLRNTELKKNFHLLYPLSAIGIENYKANDIALEVNKESDYVGYVIIVWQKVGGRYVPQGCGSSYSQYKTIGEFEELVNDWPYYGIDGWQKLLDDMIDHDAWIPILHIAPMIEVGRAQKYLDHREKKMVEREREDEEREEKRRAEEQRRAAEEAEQKRADAARLEENIAKAVMIIKNGGDFVNFDGTLVLELAKRAGITVPLRSDGWIRKWLYAVGVKDGAVTHTRLNDKGTKTSDSMFNLLDKIVAYYYGKEVS